MNKNFFGYGIKKFVMSMRITSHLTKGKLYEVIEQDVNFYYVKSDLGNLIKTSALNFYSIEEKRDILLSNII